MEIQMAQEFNIGSIGQRNNSHIECDYISKKFHLLFDKKKMGKEFGIFYLNSIMGIITDIKNDANRGTTGWGIFQMEILQKVIECSTMIRRIESNINRLESRRNFEKFDKKIRSISKHLINGQEFMLIPDELIEISKDIIKDSFGPHGYIQYTFG